MATVLFGAAAGGLTNAVAIWMLFHPHTPRGWWRFRFQGAIPKNRDRLAKGIGKTVGERLLTSEDLRRQIAAPKMREAFDRALSTSLASLLETQFGSVREELPAGVRDEVVAVLRGAGAGIAQRLAEFSTTPAFEDAVRRFLTQAQSELADRPVSEILTVARREALREHVEEWVADATQSAELERAVRDFVHRQLIRFESDTTPLIERLPVGLVGALEHSIADYLPVALERVGAALGNPDFKQRLVKTLRELLNRAVQDLLPHERLVAKLMVTERTIERLLSGLEGEGVLKLGSMLEDSEVRDQVARAINDAVVRFLNTPLSERIAALGPERRNGLGNAAGDYILSALRDASTQQRAIGALDRVLEGTEQRTWGDLLAKLPPDQAVSWTRQALAAPQTQRWIAQATDSLVDTIIDRPIGRPVDLLPAEAVPRLTVAASDAIWDWTQRQVPRVVSQLGVQDMVEEKVRGFSIQRMEDLIRGITERELQLIIRFGWILGGFVGGIAFAVNLLLR